MTSVETKILISGLFFFALFGILIGLILPEELQNTASLSNVTDQLNPITGTTIADIPILGNVLQVIFDVVLTVIFFLIDTMFSIFGVDIISGIVILPAWLNTLLLLYSVVIFYCLIMIIIDRIWIG